VMAGTRVVAHPDTVVGDGAGPLLDDLHRNADKKLVLKVRNRLLS
jgi:hypothetical protein